MRSPCPHCSTIHLGPCVNPGGRPKGRSKRTIYCGVPIAVAEEMDALGMNGGEFFMMFYNKECRG